MNEQQQPEQAQQAQPPRPSKRMPVVAIVGRPNVGKSSLLNALVGKRVSIVQDMPGVTRDRVSVPLRIELPGGEGRYVELVDTGGYGFVDPDRLTDHIRHQIELAMSRADLVLFLVDCQAGLTSGDEEIASLLRRQGIRAVLVANKADGPRLDAMLGDFARLGFGTPVGVSATNERNLHDLLDAIRGNLDLSGAPATVPEPEMMVAIVGKRNAGKSTLVNAVARLYEGAEEDRVIVSEVPGTTRDSVDVRFEKEGKALVVIDTAGVRKKRHMVTSDVEFYSFHRAQRSVRRADVVFLLIDGMEPVSEPDKKLAAYVAEQHKPVVIVVNKWDLVLESARKQAEEKKTGFSADLLMEEFRQYLDQELRFLDYAPVAFITARDGRKVQAVLDLAQHLFNQARTRVTTGKLNQAVRQVLQERTPSTPSGRKAKVFYATQVDVAPPTIVLVVNNPAFIDEAYQRFIVNRFRDLLPYPEVPIRLIIKPRGQRTSARSLDEMEAGEAQEVAAETGEMADMKGAVEYRPWAPPLPPLPARPAAAQRPKPRAKAGSARPGKPHVKHAGTRRPPGKGPAKGGGGLKPRPKPTARRGPARGTRPKR